MNTMRLGKSQVSEPPAYKIKRKTNELFSSGRTIRWFLLCAIFLIFFAQPVTAAPGNDPVKAALISEVESIQPGKPFWVAIRLMMDEGWHTYWKNPGDAGLATRFAWTLPDGFRAGDIEWPYPKRFDEASVITYGYDEEVFLLSQITPPTVLEAGKTVSLQVRLDWLSCKELCLPGHADVAITLPVKNEEPKKDFRRLHHFSQARLRLPMRLPEWRMLAALKPQQATVMLSRSSKLPHQLTGVEFFPDRPGLIKHAAPQRFQKEGDVYFLTLALSPSFKDDNSRLEGALVSKEGWGGVEDERALRVDVPLESNLVFAVINKKPSFFKRKQIFIFIAVAVFCLVAYGAWSRRKSLKQPERKP